MVAGGPFRRREAEKKIKSNGTYIELAHTHGAGAHGRDGHLCDLKQTLGLPVKQTGSVRERKKKQEFVYSCLPSAVPQPALKRRNRRPIRLVIACQDPIRPSNARRTRNRAARLLLTAPATARDTPLPRTPRTPLRAPRPTVSILDRALMRSCPPKLRSCPSATYQGFRAFHKVRTTLEEPYSFQEEGFWTVLPRAWQVIHTSALRTVIQRLRTGLARPCNGFR